MLKTLDPRSLIIGVLITMVVVAFMLVATADSPRAQWEYKSLTLFGPSHEATLNGLGKDEWELVGFSHTPGGRNENEVSSYILKRSKVYSNKPRWKFW